MKGLNYKLAVKSPLFLTWLHLTYLMLFKFEASNGLVFLAAATLAGLLRLLGALGLSK